MTAAKGGNTPSFTSGCANLALGVAMTISPKATSSDPAPIAGPFTTTISGLEISRIALNTRLKASSVWKTRSGRERLLRRSQQDRLDLRAHIQALNRLRQLRHHGNRQYVVRSMVQRDAGDPVTDVELNKFQLFAYPGSCAHRRPRK